VKESLRIRPPIFLVARLTELDDYLGDYFIPKGTHIFVQMNNVHNYADVWKNAAVFDPDRWIENENENEDNENQKMWIPFLLGSRNCIGSRFALLEIKAILCTLIQKYEFWLPPDHPKVKAGLHIASKLTPYLKVRIESRK